MNSEEIWNEYQKHGFGAVVSLGCNSLQLERFFQRSVNDHVFKHEGDVSELWTRIEKYPSIYGDKHHFKKTVSMAIKAAVNLMQGNDDSVIRDYKVEVKTLESKTVTYNQIRETLYGEGIHVLKLGIGSGKSNLIFEDVKRYGDGARLLVIVPSVLETYEYAKRLGDDWKHYHHFGKDAESVKQAICSFKKLVMCSGSLAKFKEFRESLRRFQCIYFEEYAKVEKQYCEEKLTNTAFRESFESFFDLLRLSNRTLILSADVSERHQLKVLGKAAVDTEKSIFLYKNNSFWLEGSEWIRFREEYDLIWEVCDRINNNQRAFGTFDFADISKAHFSTLVNFIKDNCPGKKIHAFTSDSLKHTLKGMQLTEQGFNEYIEYYSAKNELDALIISPVATHNLSLLFDNPETRFDFTFGIHRGINDADTVHQAQSRPRETRTHLYHVKQGAVFPITEKSSEKDVPVMPDDELFNNLPFHKRMIKLQRIENAKSRICKRANKDWLVKLNLESKGARVITGILNREGRNEEYLKFRSEYLDVLANTPKSAAKESRPFQRLRLFNQFITWDDVLGEWTQLSMDSGVSESDLNEIQKTVSVDIAERILLILQMEPEVRGDFNDGFEDLYYTETGELLDQLFSHLLVNKNLQSLCRFYLKAGTGSVWYGLIEESQRSELDKLIKNNYTNIYRNTLGTFGNEISTLRGFIERIIAKHLQLEIWTRVGKEERNKWRDSLFKQYLKEFPGKMAQARGIRGQYALIEDLVREKIRKNPEHEFSESEKRLLDTMKDVVKIKRPSTPIISKLRQLYGGPLMNKDFLIEEYFDPPTIKGQQQTERESMVRRGPHQKSV